MADVDEIIDYIKSLKRGFDKDLFQSKIDELTQAVDASGLEYDDFHTLFKVWLNLSIPITKWVSLGACIVPQDRVQERTIDYAFRWLLANCEHQANLSRIAFVLDWLTAAMDSACIDMVALDSGYEIFFTMLTYDEVLTGHTLKLVYTLSKPSDVSRKKVLELLEYSKKNEDKKSLYHKIQVLLGLFKSYRPDCVPENVPAISIHTSFKKINVALVERFRRSQERNNNSSRERQHLLWISPIIDGSTNKKASPLLPHMECNINKQCSEKALQKSYLDFSDPAALLHHSLQHAMDRPARVRALLCNDTGLTLLALSSHTEQAFLSHDLYHLLSSCFLAASPHSYAEKQALLRRLAALQRTLLQAVPVVTRFLAQYLPLWNERDYFGEILELVEWLDMEHASHVVEALSQVYQRAQPLEQCAIARSLANMYANMVYSSTRVRHHFLGGPVAAGDFSHVLPHVASSITRMCDKALQASPEDMRVLYSSVLCAETMARAEARCSVAIGALPGPLTLALPLLAPSAALIDKMAALLILYKKIMSKMKSANNVSPAHIDQRKVLKEYMSDVLNCLHYEMALSDGHTGFVFSKMEPQTVAKLNNLVPGADAIYSLRNNLAFAAYTDAALQAVHPSDANKFCLDSLSLNLPSLRELFLKAIPEYR